MTDEISPEPPDSSDSHSEGGEADRLGASEVFAFLNALNEGTFATLGQIVRGEINHEEMDRRAKALRRGYAQLGLAEPLEDEEEVDGPRSPSQ